ncbi:MAG: GNAT family N-acetyltransferase [Myxococcales bacterium]|nr:GNAT family N-acetyltransferase [Myxococcales bacterium]MDP3501024.1 GNAT family N-acetyltransferase [Myxococcales bacterium]
MRRREYEAPAELGLELFDASEAFHLAGAAADGLVLKTLHGVVDDGWLCFHGAPAGEKTSLLGCQVVVSVEETVARVPSFFIDAERACPATTLFRAAQARGVLTAIDEPVRKARVLQRLMEKLQPEGGHQPIEAASPLYRAAVKGLLIAGLPLSELTAKAKLMQNKNDETRARVLEQLWRRGAPGDVRAIELILAANPSTGTPAFLQGPRGVRLHADLHSSDQATAHLDAAVALLRRAYWNDVFTEAELRAAHRGSAVWVGATDEQGVLIGTARAITDTSKYAWVYDVCVRQDWRGRGVGQALMTLVLDHPQVRRCRRVRLGTRDAQSLYARFGFVDTSTLRRPYVTTEMVLAR